MSPITFSKCILFKQTIIHTLMIFQAETRDALLHAINEEYVEAVEVLLENEEEKWKEGDLHVSASKIP